MPSRGERGLAVCRITAIHDGEYTFAVVSAVCIGSLNLSGRFGQDIQHSPCLISTVKLQTVEAKSRTKPKVTWTCSYKGKAEYCNTKGYFMNFLCVSNSQMLGQACFQNTITP